MPERETVEPEETLTRSFWSGTITFGLVSIPVALYAANRSGGIPLRMVAPDGTPLNRRYFTSKDDRRLEPDEIVRGFEIEKDRFVIVDDEELERLAPERTRDIDVRRFVDASDIDPMYFERAYYLAPGSNSTKAYRLLAQVMEETGQAGIATFVMRAKEYLVAIVAENGILRAETLRFADELRSPDDVGLPAPKKPAPAEVKRIDKEIAGLVEDSLNRRELVDHSVERLRKLAERKLRAGEDVFQIEERPDDEERGEPTGVIDLMQILKSRIQHGVDERAIAADMAEADDDDSGDDDAGKRKGGRSGARKSPARKSGAKKSSAKKSSAKKSGARKSSARKSSAKKSAAKKTSGRKSAGR